MAEHADLSIDFCGVQCENPFFLSSSPIAATYEMNAKALEAGWGGIVFKTIGTYIPDECSPRFDHIAKEGSPFVGFKNVEQISDHPYEKNLEWVAKLKKDFPDKVIIVSIMGMDETDWTNLSRDVTQAGADILECNFSCPQMTCEGMGSDVGADEELITDFTKATVAATHLPVMPKMTPNIEKMEVPARAAIKAGGHAIAAINTIKAITGVDLDTFCGYPIVNGKSAISGYSGKAVKPIALRFIAQMAQDPELEGIPLSGIGGIETWQDAAEFLMLGASNLQVTTSVMQYGYRIVEDMISGLSIYCAEKGFNALSDMVGIALDNIIPADDLERDFKIIPKIDQDKCVGCGRCYLSCFDGAHQAIEWDAEKREPSIDDDLCVGCHLCIHVCPVRGCITPGKTVFKPQDQFGLGSEAKYIDGGPNKRKIDIGISR
jgi:dihydropyrimidine dehydrogenase (NAD+) subunit PreA